MEKVILILATIYGAVLTFIRERVEPVLDKFSTKQARRFTLRLAVLSYVAITFSLLSLAIAAAIAVGVAIAYNLVFKRFNR